MLGKKMKNTNCIMCDDQTLNDERLYATDFKVKGQDVPLCSTCEKDHFKYLGAVVFAKALWKNK